MDCDCESKSFFPPIDLYEEIRKKEYQILLNMQNTIINAFTNNFAALKKVDGLKEELENRAKVAEININDGIVKN